jgi:hypothetical protein
MAETIMSCGRRKKLWPFYLRSKKTMISSVWRTMLTYRQIKVECHTVNGSTNNMDKGNVNDDENLDSFQTPNGRCEQGNNEHDKSNNHDVVGL